jgi:hypothetical protein
MKKTLLTLVLLPLLFSCDFSFSSDETTLETEKLDIEPVLLTTLPALKSLYTDKFLIGNIISPSETTGSRFTYLKYHFNVLTAENAM